MQQWEYQIVMRTRGLARTGNTLGVGSMNAGEFSPNGDDMLRQLAEMGREGWELVSVAPRISMHSSPISTEEVWVFKRPIA